MRPTLPVLALLAAVALASCGESTIDAAKGEKFIRGVVAKQVGARVATVSCPGDIETKKGDRFTCTVTGADGSKGDVLVTQRDDDGNVAVSAPFLHVREAETVMAEQIAKQTKEREVKVACPEIIVVKKSELFRCKATGGDKSRDVSARLTDEQGRFRYRLT